MKCRLRTTGQIYQLMKLREAMTKTVIDIGSLF